MAFNKFNLGILGIALLFLIAACSSQAPINNEPTGNEPVGHDNQGMVDSPKTEPKNSESSEWLTTQLKDVNSGNSFTLNDFKGKTVLVESFAVWCPTCTKQQEILKGMRTSESDNIVHVSLDLDPNEDEAKVLQHAKNGGYDWNYAVSPTTMTQALLKEFGPSIGSAPSVPIILICEDQSFRLLGRGLKSAEKLDEEIGKGCNL